MSSNHPKEINAAAPSRRERLNTLLFQSATLGVPLLALAAFVAPKLPPMQGE